jgi:hypothetical protein
MNSDGIACASKRWGETLSSPDIRERRRKSGLEGTLAPPNFMGREDLQDLDVNRDHEPTPAPLPGGEPATAAANEAPLLGGAGGGFIERSLFN